MRPTSLFVLCVAAVVVGSDALAGPLDESILRGSAEASYGDESASRPSFVPGTPIRYRWEGLYFGAHAGYTGAGVDFGNGTGSLVDYILRNDVVGTHVSGWTTLSKGDSSRASFGGFAGYNFQADELVYGVEANYSLINSQGIRISAADSMTRIFNDDTAAPAQHHYFYTATVSSSASVRLIDFGTLRLRAGVALDKFLPYAFAGAALGRVDVVRSATVSYLREDIPDNVAPPAPPITPQPDFNFGPQTRSEQRDGAFAYGYTAGLGVDVALMPNVFMRAPC
jgi:opacity protein-like surface antigen